jgi:hypothetical protein
LFQAHKVLKFLRAYILGEEKDRMHSVNHYEHVRDTEPEEGQRIRNAVIEHLSMIDQRVNQSLEMLARFPDLEKKVMPEIGESSVCVCLVISLRVLGCRFE